MVRCIHETNIFTNRKLVTIYVRSTLHEYTEFLQERQLWLGRLYLVFKKLILSKKQVQTSVDYPMQSVMLSQSSLMSHLMSSAHVPIKS